MNNLKKDVVQTMFGSQTELTPSFLTDRLFINKKRPISRLPLLDDEKDENYRTAGNYTIENVTKRLKENEEEIKNLKSFKEEKAFQEHLADALFYNGEDNGESKPATDYERKFIIELMECEFYSFWDDIKHAIEKETEKLEKSCHSCLFVTLTNLKKETEGYPLWKVRYIYEQETIKNLTNVRRKFNDELHQMLKYKPEYFKNYMIDGKFKELFHTF